MIGKVLRDRPVLLANLGYFGHMWELYAMWTWLVVFLAASFATSDARLVAFAVIGVAGGVGAVAGGLLADRIGRTTVTMAAMIASATCCLVSPLAITAPAAVMIGFGLIWGATIVADSAQFSAAVTELAEPAYMGTALTLQTSLGFALTLIPIWTAPLLADAIGWRYVFLLLAPGPILGTVAMAALRRRPEAVRLAAGRR
jgi:MFS family permease